MPTVTLTRATLERHQVVVYLIAIALGLVLGLWFPAVSGPFDALLWPVLALLLYVTFLQVPLTHLREALADRRFMAAVLLGNFVLVPLVVWAMLPWLPDSLPIQLGVLLVLLVPCTDWFITFAQLGRGSTARAIAVTPLNLLLQLLLLPLYVVWMLGDAVVAAVPLSSLWPAVLIVLLPLIAAWWTERWIEQASADAGRAAIRERAAWWPVPLLGAVVFLIAGAQVGEVQAGIGLIAAVVPFFVAFLLIAAGLGVLLARVFRLQRDAGRTLIFSLGSRNSFIVLPFALALPGGFELAAIVIVVQSLVELFGMVLYLWWVPRLLPDAPRADDAGG